MPCHHNREDELSAYIDGGELREDRKGPLFRTIARGTKRLRETPPPQANPFAMVRRRAGAAEIGTAIGHHSFRATGIPTYLKNGGTLEPAATMAKHRSSAEPRDGNARVSTRLYRPYPSHHTQNRKPPDHEKTTTN